MATCYMFLCNYLRQGGYVFAGYWKIEDILIKMIRLVANLSINADIGFVCLYVC